MQIPFSSNKPSTPAPEGAHPARLVRVVDLGTQISTFQDKEISARKLSLAWELYGEKMEDGRPFMVSERYTMSLNEKSSLHKLLASWLGKEFDKASQAGTFDFSSLLGRACLVTVNHKVSKTGSVFAKLAGVTQLPKGLMAETQCNPSVMFDLSKPDMDIYAGLPRWQQEEIAKSPEFHSFRAPTFGPDDDTNVDIPF